MKKKFPKEVWLNGQWYGHDQAFISVFDRGFLFGDGIYEVIPFYGGKPFTLDEHLARMQSGLDTVAIPFSIVDLKPTIADTISRTDFPAGEGAVYIQVTRGVAPRTHHFPAEATPTVMLYAFPLVLGGFASKQASVMVSNDFRWHRCDIKSISLIGNVLANEAAHKQEVSENILSRGGFITEGSHTNVFFVKGGVVYTHPANEHVLPGITRKVVLDICARLNITAKEEAFAESHLSTIDEAFLTGTTAQILAITAVRKEGTDIFSTAEAGPITKKIQEAFKQRIPL